MRAPSASDSACSLHLNCPSAYKHNIHRDTLLSITHTLKTCCNAGICTHLGKIKAHNHSLGDDLADTLANQAANGYPPDTAYTTGSNVSIGHWTWPYTLIPQTLGEPIPYRYTNLKTDAHTHITKHTQHSQISSTHTSKNSCGESTTPAFLLITPPCAAPYVANSLATATWPVTAPLCLD